MRQGNWEFSLPFAIGQTQGEFVESIQFPIERVDVVPILAEFATSGINPSGSRHLTTHPSFIDVLASGRGAASLNFDNLDMQSIDIGPGSGVSCTKVFLFRISEFDCPTTSRVYNMKVWASSITDFLTENTHKVIYETHNTWQQDLTLPVSDMLDPDKFLPTSLPEFQNLTRQDGGVSIHGSGDADVSSWIYVAVAASGTLPLGSYGSTSASGFLIRVTYDQDNIFPFRD